MTITCTGCTHTWTAQAAAHCAACHHTFATVRLFDTHRTQAGPHGGCLDPATITTQKGEHVLVHRGGMWRTLELTTQQRTTMQRVWANATPREPVNR